MLVREIAVGEVEEGDSLRSQTPVSPDAMRLEHAREIRLVVLLPLPRAGTVKVNVCFRLPDVANRTTHPDREFAVVNGTLMEVAPVGMMTDAAMENALLVANSVTTVGEGAGSPSVMTQLPEMPCVRVTGVQDSDSGLVLGATVREMVAVKFVAPNPAVITAF